MRHDFRTGSLFKVVEPNHKGKEVKEGKEKSILLNQMKKFCLGGVM